MNVDPAGRLNQRSSASGRTYVEDPFIAPDGGVGVDACVTSRVAPHRKPPAKRYAAC